MDLETPAVLLAAFDEAAVMNWMQYAFYPALLGILVMASLGIPIPEDIPLIAAGAILYLHPETANFWLTFLVAMIGIMSGDLVLYTVGKWWGRGVLNHRSVSWMLSEKSLDKMTERFHEYGVWMCFFGRFFVGIRAVMCMTAGVTRFPYWKFFLADFSGALLSVPLFIGLGYWFAETLPLLKQYLGNAQLVALLVIVGGGLVALGWWKFRLAKREAKGPQLAEKPGEQRIGDAEPRSGKDVVKLKSDARASA